MAQYMYLKYHNINATHSDNDNYHILPAYISLISLGGALPALDLDDLLTSSATIGTSLLA